MLKTLEVQDTGAGDRSREMRRHAVPVLLGLAGALVALGCTGRYGMGTSPDSASYLAAARSLLAGDGYRYFDGDPYTQWPPLFPTLLALPGLIGIDALTAARWLNAVSFGLSVFLAGELFLRCTRSRVFALLATISVLASTSLFDAAVMVWSEPVFILLVILFVLAMPHLLRQQSPGWLLAVAALAGLACLQRYAGVSLILAGGLLIVCGMSGASFLRRAIYLAGFGILSAGPLFGWIMRNRMWYGRTAGGHNLHGLSLAVVHRTLEAALDVVAGWLFPRSLAPSFGLVGAGLILGLTAVLIVSLWTRAGERRSLRGVQIGCAVVFGLVYFWFLVLASAELSWDPEPRLMTPLYAAAMVVVFAGIEETARIAREKVGGGNRAALVGLTVCLIGLIHPLETTTARIRGYARHGLGDFGSPLWQQSPVLLWLRTHPLPGMIYSNVPDAVYLGAGRPARHTPVCYTDTTQFAAAMPPAPAHYVVWFHWMYRNLFYDLPELASRWRLEEVASLPDGAVYRFLGPGGPGVCAVYRFWSPRLERHLYTVDKRERDDLVLNHSDVWTYEGPVFYVFDSPRADTVPVHCFESTIIHTCFYVVDENEKAKLDGPAGSGWTYRGVAFHVYPRRQEEKLQPVHRFWSPRSGYHFYTLDSEEKEKLVQLGWVEESVVWYAYGPWRPAAE